MADEQGIQERRERRIRFGQTVRVLVALAAIAFLVVFSATNTEEVEIDYGFGQVTAPMILVIVASAVVGLVIGLAIGGRRTDS